MAERKADLATAQFKQQGTQYLLDNMGTVNQQQMTDLMAKIATAGTVKAQADNATSQAQTFASRGGNAFAGAAQAQAAQNALAQNTADFSTAKLGTLAANALGANWTTLAQTQAGYLQGYTLSNGATTAPSATQASAAQAAAQTEQAPQSLAGYTKGSTVGQLPAGTGPLAATPASPPPSSASWTASGGAPWTKGSVAAPGTGALAAPPAAPQTPVPASAGSTAAAFAPGTQENQIASVIDPTSATNTGNISVQQAASVIPGIAMASADPAMTAALINMRRAEIIAKTTTLKDVSEYDQATGNTALSFVRYNMDGSIFSKSDPIIVKSDSARVLQRSAADVVNLQTSRDQLANLQSAYNDWTKVYGKTTGFGNLLQGISGSNAASEEPGFMSAVMKGLGGLTSSKETTKLVAAIQSYNQSLAKLDPDTQKGASSIGITPRDLITPEQLGTKIDSSQGYVNSRLTTYIKDNISPRITGNNSADVAPSVQGKQVTPGSVPQGTHTVRFANGTSVQAYVGADGKLYPVTPQQAAE